MLTVTVTYDPSANRSPDTVKLNGHSTLTPKAAIAARNVAAGMAANAYVTDGTSTYRVTRNNARKVER